MWNKSIFGKWGRGPTVRAGVFNLWLGPCFSLVGKRISDTEDVERGQGEGGAPM